MEKKLMRVTYKQTPGYEVDAVGRAQVLIDKDAHASQLSLIRRRVKSIMATLGNMRWYNEIKESSDDSKKLLAIAKKGIAELKSYGHEIVHLEVKIMDLDFHDFFVHLLE